MDEQPVRIFELCVERLETLEDVKKILKTLQIRIDTSNPLFEDLQHYFSVEVIPRGYIKVLEKVGYEKITKMGWDEIEQMGKELLNKTEIND